MDNQNTTPNVDNDSLSSQQNSSVKIESYIIPLPPKVYKRDGRLVDFDKTKIEVAISKAFKSLQKEVAQEELSNLTSLVVTTLSQTFLDRIPSVEDVQDIVEKQLAKSEYFDVAKHYILYREQHKALRQETSEKIAGPIVHIKKDDGSYIPFDYKQVETLLRNSFGDLGDKTVMYDILEDVRRGVFDGISEKDLHHSIILAVAARIEIDPDYSKIAARLVLNTLYKDILGVEELSENFKETYHSLFKAKMKEGVDCGRLTPRMLEYDFSKLSAALVPERDHILEYMGVLMFTDKYVLKNPAQDLLEVPQYFWMRVAMGMALNEEEKELRAIEFYNVISQLLYTPSSPTLYHSGLTHSQMSSCFLMTVMDDLDHIFKTYSDQAQLSKYAGGVGIDWSNIRATGTMIKSTNVSSQGVIPFLKICDSTNAAINRSGRKRGATVVYLETWHYDVESFLELRRNTGDERRRTHNINTAMWIPDLFVKRVLNNDKWTLFSPHDVPELHSLYGKAFEEKYIEYEQATRAGKIKFFKEVSAKDLWRKMITMLFETGHPWMTFKDPCNIRSPQDHVGVVNSSNLCTEITLNTSIDEVAVCNLGSINLANHVSDDGRINKKLLSETINVAVRMLDNILDLNFYPIKETKNSNMLHRPIGLGIMGLQDVFYKMNMNFDSEQAVRVTDELQEYVSYHAIFASSRLAKEKGKYKTYEGSKWSKGIFPVDTIEMLEKERGINTYVSKKGKLDWSSVREHVKKYGMRNSNTMAIAPTASISGFVGSFPSIEPPYSNLYVKSNMFGEFTIVNKYLVQDLKEIGMWSPAMLTALKQTDGDISTITSIPIHIRDKYKGAFSVSPHWVIRHAAYRGKWIDQSQSVNIFTSTTKGSELSDIYLDAWKSGLKTTYYLRTLGATGIEKSSVAIKASASADIDVLSVREEPALSPTINVAPIATYQATDIKVTTEQPTLEISSEKVTVSAYEVKNLCKLDDPTCESCQ